MVKYACGICSKIYDSFEKAEECEKRGTIGPKIKSGFLLKTDPLAGGYLIVERDTLNRRHEREYSFIEIAKLCREEIGLRTKLITPITWYTVDSWIISKEVRLLTEKEFGLVKKFIDEKSFKIKEVLERFEIGELYIRHPAFDKYDISKGDSGD